MSNLKANSQVISDDVTRVPKILSCNGWCDFEIKRNMRLKPRRLRAPDRKTRFIDLLMDSNSPFLSVTLSPQAFCARL